MSDFDSALQIVTDRGDKISNADLMKIEMLLGNLPIEDYLTARSRVFEAIELIVNDPSYSGDIELDD